MIERPHAIGPQHGPANGAHQKWIEKMRLGSLTDESPTGNHLTRRETQDGVDLVRASPVFSLRPWAAKWQ